MRSEKTFYCGVEWFLVEYLINFVTHKRLLLKEKTLGKSMDPLSESEYIHIWIFRYVKFLGRGEDEAPILDIPTPSNSVE